MLPSVVSLKSLRAFARKEQGAKPMTGFGDPLFDPSQEGSGDKRAAKPGAVKSAARGVTSVAYTDFWRGAGVDRAQAGAGAAAIARYRRRTERGGERSRRFRIRHSSRQDASETTVKRAPLADYGIVYFATHGLVAGDVKGLAEPSLALSIPEAAFRTRRRPAHRERSRAIETQCRLGGAVRLQHHRRRQARRGSAFGPGAVVLLCRRPRASGIALGGRFGGRDAADHIDLRSPESRSEARP